MKNKKSMHVEVRYWKNNRFAIYNIDNNEVVDDAQGYGYKDRKKAGRAMWYKFKGGREKISNGKQQLKKWLENANNRTAFLKLQEEIEDSIKELHRGETTVEKIIQEIEKNHKIFFLNFVKKNLDYEMVHK